MAQNLARDEAGNVWDTSVDPPRLVQQAGASNVVPPNPARVAQQQADAQRQADAASRAQASDVREQTRFAERDKPQAPAGYRFNAAGDLEPIPGGPAMKDTAGEQDKDSVRAEALDKIRLARTLLDRSKNGYFTTGIGAGIARNFGGTNAYDVQQDTETLKNAGALTRIMEMARTNGGKNPLTPLSNADFQALSSSLSNLDTAQSDAQYQANVQRVIDMYERAYQAAGGTDLQGELAGRKNRIDGTLSASGGNSGAPPPPSASAGGLSGGRPPLLGPGEEVSFTGDRRDPTAKRYEPEQEARIAQAIRDGDLGQALSLHQRFSGNPPTSETIESTRSAIAQLKANPNLQIEVGYGAADAAAENAANRERFGDYLPQAIDERNNQGAATARGLLNGATLGAAPYISAGVQSGFGLAPMLGGNSFTDRLQNARAIDQADYTNNFGWRLGGDIVGGAATAGGLEVGLARAGANLGGRAGSIVGSPRTADALFGATTGGFNSGGDPLATAGGTIAGVGGGMFGRSLARPAAAAGRGVGRMIGRPTEVPSATDRSLFKALDQGGMNTASASLNEAQALGLPMTLADTTPAARSLAGVAVRRSPNAAGIAEKTLLPRAREQIERFGQAVERDLGPVANVPQLTKDLQDQAKLRAGPLYDAAYAQPGAGAVFPQIEPFLSRPSMQTALKNATSLAKEEGRDPTSLGFNLNAAGEPELTRVPSWQTLDYMKRGLDDVVETYRDGTTGRLNLNTQGNATNSTLRDFVKTVDSVNPTYAQARSAYAGPAQEAEWLRRGQSAIDANPNQLGVDTANLSPERMGQMQLGFRSGLMDRAEKVRFSSNPFDAALGTVQAEKRLATMFPDNPGVANLLRQRDLEAGMAKTNNDILGNSMTAGRQIADQAFAGGDLPGAVMDVALNVGMGQVPTSAVRNGLGRSLRDMGTLGVGKKATQRAEALAPSLFNTNPQQNLDEIARIAAALQGYNATVGNARRLTSPLGALGGGMFGASLGGY